MLMSLDAHFRITERPTMQFGPHCPEVNTLMLFSNGELSDAEADPLTEHIQSCDHCLEWLRNSPKENDLIESLQCSHHSSINDPIDREVVSMLIARLRVGSSGANESSSQDQSDTAQPTDEDASEPDWLWIHSILSKTKGSFSPFELGQYTITKRIGIGGMGVVFEAQDPILGRAVAIKIIHPKMIDSESSRQRFLNEARAIATLEHEYIVPVYYVGDERGVPFLVMPLLRGETLESRMQRDGTIPIAEVLQIGKQLAIGLSAAHRMNIVHRDIKPSNVWLDDKNHAMEPIETSPKIKILDFGLAFDEDRDHPLNSAIGFAGTPAFMPPEQALSQQVDARSDLFSLGCVLYYMCTGQLPFQGRNAIATLLSVIEKKPNPLSTAHRPVPASLELLINQLLEKNPERRPQTASLVATKLLSIENSLRAKTALQPSLPKLSKSASGWYLFGIVAIACAMVLPILWGVVFKLETPHGTIVLEMDSQTAEGAEVRVDGQHSLTVRLKNDKDPIEIKTKSGKHNLSVTKNGFELFSQEFTMLDGERQSMRVHIEPSAPENGVTSLVSSSSPLPGLIPNPNKRDGYRRWQIETKLPRGELGVLAWDADSHRIACGSTNGYVRILDADSLQLKQIIPAHSGPIRSMDWSPKSNLILTIGLDGILQMHDVLEKRSRILVANYDSFRTVSFSPNGKLFACVGEGKRIQIWRANGTEWKTLEGSNSAIASICWHPSGDRLAAAYDDGHVKSWNIEEEKAVLLPAVFSNVVGLAWNPKGTRLAVGEANGMIRSWELDGGFLEQSKGHPDGLSAIAWSQQDQLATSDKAGNVRFWTNDLAVAKSLSLGPSRIDSLKWNADGSKLAVASDDSLRILNEAGSTIKTFSSPTAPVRSVSWHQQGILASTGDDATVRIWDSDGKQQSILRGHSSKAFAVSWNQDAKRLLSAGWDQKVHVWDIVARKAEILNGHDPIAWNPVRDEILWSSYDKIALGTSSQSMRLLAPQKGVIHSLAWNGDGSKFASSDNSGWIQIWNRDGSSIASMKADAGVVSLKWHPTLPILASASLVSGNIQLWNDQGQRQSIWQASFSNILSLAWNPEGTRIASTAIDQSIRISSIDGIEVASITNLPSLATSIDWTHGGEQITSAHVDGTIRQWDSTELRLLATNVLFADGNWCRFEPLGEKVVGSLPDLDARFIGIAEDDQGTITLIPATSLITQP